MEEIAVPIHVYTPPPEELLPRAVAYVAEEEEDDEEVGEEVVVIQKRGSGRMVSTMKIAGMVIALGFVTLAVVGSGYLDQYILSNSQVRIMAGVGLYNK